MPVDYQPGQIDFSALGGMGQKLGQARKDRNALPWARSDWQGAPQGYAMGWNTRPWGGQPFRGQGISPFVSNSPQRGSGGFPMPPRQSGPMFGNGPQGGLPSDPWAWINQQPGRIQPPSTDPRSRAELIPLIAG